MEKKFVFVVMRQDDNGNQAEVARFETREEAEETAKKFEARGHKQLYWVEARPLDEATTPGRPFTNS